MAGRIRLIIVVVLTTFLGACASVVAPPEVVHVNPSYGHIVLFNDSSFYLQDTGIINKSVGPGEHIDTNVGCYKRLRGLIDVYKIVGKNSAGKDVLKWYGQRKYSVRTDGKNRTIRGISVDAYVIFTDHDFRPGGSRVIWSEGDPCSSGPTFKFEF